MHNIISELEQIHGGTRFTKNNIQQNLQKRYNEQDILESRDRLRSGGIRHIEEL